MRNLLLMLLMHSAILACCSSTPTYRQTRIPLDNFKGVPFFKDEIDYYIDGFEVDVQGNFYFLGGQKNTFAVFSDSKLKFRNNISEFKANKLYLFIDTLYVLDNTKNNLYVLNMSNGLIIKRYNNIIENQINSFEFIEKSIIAEVFDNKEKIDMSTKLAFAEFSLSGKLIKQVNNRFNLPNNLYPQKFEENSIQYMGEWNNALLFMGGEMDKGIYKFWLQNIDGQVISTANIEYKIFGEFYYGNPNEHRKLRNESIFVLGRDGNNAIITELPLKELFK